MNTNTTVISRILFLDREFQPIGTKVITRPNALFQTDRRDSKNIMAVGMGAFDDGEFERVPCYWVVLSGAPTTEDYDRLTIKQSGLLEKHLFAHVRFVSYREIDKKIQTLMKILDFKEAYRVPSFKPRGDFDDVVNLSLTSPEGATEDINLFDLLYSINLGIEECTDAIKIVKDKINKARKDLRYIEEIARTFKCNCFMGKIPVGDGYVQYPEVTNLTIRPARDRFANNLHALKSRLNTLERRRSYLYEFMHTFIFASIWWIPVSEQ